MLKIGSHVSFKAKEYLVGAIKESLSYGATAAMIYLGAPQNTRRVDKTLMKLEEYEKEYQSLIPKENILVHAPYIINPSSVEKHQFAIDFLIKEIEIMNFLNLKQIVLHPGAHTKFTRAEGVNTLIKSLKEIISKTKNVEILLETMAGKGTEIGTSFEELKDIINKVNSNRVHVCLDTCHIWDAGYDVNNFEKLMQKLKESKLLENIKAIHINNSKNELGANKDRHENLNNGYIKTESLRKIVHASEFQNIIKVLETPYIDGKPPYKEEIALLK